MGGSAALWTDLRRATDDIVAQADDLTVAVVANTKASVPSTPHDRSTEYLSDDEASQLLGSLREAGFRTRFFAGEAEFLRHALADPKLGTTSERLLIYNLAQSGDGPGRKSLVPAFCALLGLTTCNSDAYAVSLARNKVHVQAILAHHGLPVPDTWTYSADGGWLLGRRPPSGVTLIAKAAYESASIGLDGASVGVADDVYEATLARKSEALRQPIIVQTLVEGREFEVPVARLGPTRGALGAAVVTLDGSDDLGTRVLDFDAVARDAYGYEVPIIADEPLVTELGVVASATYDVLGLSGFARVDFRVGRDGGVRVIDVATSPHLVLHSAYARVFQERGWSHRDMLACMVAINAARAGWV